MRGAVPRLYRRIGFRGELDGLERLEKLEELEDKKIPGGSPGILV